MAKIQVYIYEGFKYIFLKDSSAYLCSGFQVNIYGEFKYIFCGFQVYFYGGFQVYISL